MRIARFQKTIGLLGLTLLVGACGDDKISGPTDSTAADAAEIFVPPDTFVQPETEVTPETEVAQETSAETTPDTTEPTDTNEPADSNEPTDTNEPADTNVPTDTNDTSEPTDTNVPTDTTDVSDTNVPTDTTDADTVTPIAGASCDLPRVIAVSGALTAPIVVSGDTTGKGDDHDALFGECAGIEWDFGFGAEDEVWSFTAPVAGDYDLSLLSELDLGIYVLSDCPQAAIPTCEAGSDFAGPDEADEVTLTLAAGQTVFVVVDAYADEEILAVAGPYTLTVSAASAPGPACTDARALTLAAGVWTGSGDLFASGVEDQVEIDGCAALGGSITSDGVGTPDEAWTFTVASAGNYEITVTSDDGSDVLYALYRGPGCAAAACIGQVDNGADGEADVFTHALTAGSYTLVIDTYANFGAGPYSIRIAQGGQTCTPSCEPGACGDDGCGGECGCDVGEVCDVDVCIDDTGDTCVAPYEMFADDVGDFIEVGDLAGPDVDDDYTFEGCPALEGPANDGVGTPDEVFTFEILEAGDYVIGVGADAGVDAFFALYPGDLCDTSVECFGQIDNGGAGGDDIAVFYLPAGTYSLVVDAVDIDQAGSYFVLVTPFVIEDACAPDLFFSEYIESGANKLIEIYNGTGAAVDLADYQIWRANNGATVNDAGKFDLVDADGDSWILGDGTTWVVCSGGSDAAFKAQCDQDAGSTLLAGFTGDDYIGLVKIGVTNTRVDAIGVEGTDPGASWTVGDGTTEDHVLIRDPDVTAGNTNWATAATEWLAFSAATTSDALAASDLGGHATSWMCMAE